MEDGIVQYFPGDEGHPCGYCKSDASSFSKGMWAYALTAQNYQDLIDRGWRRSGKYCYKPEMRRTCCPAYTIRCDALSFKPTKSHKKILKRVHKFLTNGRRDNDGAVDTKPDDEDDAKFQDSCHMNEADIRLIAAARLVEHMPCDVVRDIDSRDMSSRGDVAQDPNGAARLKSPHEPKSREEAPMSCEEKPALNVCTAKKKALRKQRWLEKQRSKGPPVNPPVSKNAEKSLEEWLNLPRGKHSLEIRLVRTAPYGREAERTTDLSHAVYSRYQMKVHQEPEDKCSLSNWKNFLVDSPLLPEDDPLLGSFHQQYWLDNRLIAVGVLDLLPSCISSVYFYYDPDFEFLSLGTFASLCEIKLTRELHKKLPTMKYYYMGYYIHTCPKMRYKGRLPNSDLLCPEAYTWHPIQKCVPLLDSSKYTRLEPDETLGDPQAPSDISQALVLHKRRGTTLTDVLRQKQVPREYLEDVEEYCELVGSKVMRDIFLYIK